MRGPSCAPNQRCFPDLYLTNSDGTGQRRFARRVFEFAWSPDGRTIALARPNGIVLISASGQHERQLTHGNDSEPAWSPDGNRLAFVRDRFSRQGPKVYVLNADGTRLRSLAAGDSPRWSPNGSRIAYLAESGRGPIYLIDPSGGRPHLFVRAHEGDITEFAWVPQERRIAYVAIDRLEGDVSTICIKALRNRAARCPERMSQDNLITDMAWSPDGRSVVFHDEALETMVVVSASGKGRRALPVDGFDPSWSPNAQKIAFDQGIGVGPSYFIDANGKNLRRVAADGWSPSWRPSRTR